jgi:hypothetical protein
MSSKFFCTFLGFSSTDSSSEDSSLDEESSDEEDSLSDDDEADSSSASGFARYSAILVSNSLLWRPVWKSKFYGAFVLNHRVVLHAIDATPARWRGDAGSSPLDRDRSAASSPRSAPDTLVDFHTGGDVIAISSC